MKKLLLIFVFAFGLSTGLVFANEHSQEGNTEPVESEEVEKNADCKKVCVERDGYGKCIKFEEKCDE